MPKERIQSVTTPEFDVSVAWNRDGVVQVTTAANDADERLRNWTEVDSGDPAPSGTAPGVSFKHFDGWHVDLDRAGCNRLIKTIRQARDAAFGRDE